MKFIEKHKTTLAKGGNTKPNFANHGFTLGMVGGWSTKIKGQRGSEPASAFKKVKQPSMKSRGTSSISNSKKLKG